MDFNPPDASRPIGEVAQSLGRVPTGTTPVSHSYYQFMQNILLVASMVSVPRAETGLTYLVSDPIIHKHIVLQ